MTNMTLKRGTAVLWKRSMNGIGSEKRVFGIVKTLKDDAVEIEVIEPAEMDTIIVKVPYSEIKPL